MTEHNNAEYIVLVPKHLVLFPVGGKRRDQLNEIVEIMVEVAMNRSPVIRIGKDCEYATAFVQKRFNLINALHIEHIMEGLRENCTFVRNPKAYLMKTIFNSVTTIENSCALQHNHEFGSSW